MTCVDLQQTYYLVHFQLFKNNYYTFWYTDEFDGFLLDDRGMLQSFPTKDAAVLFAEEEGFLLDTDELFLSSAILRNINCRNLDCNLVLNHWNTFSDIAHSIHAVFIGDNSDNEMIQQIYEKLFYGCNLLLKENEQPYRPVWNLTERRWIARVMRDGLKILAKGL